jgi:HSP20 family protein
LTGQLRWLRWPTTQGTTGRGPGPATIGAALARKRISFFEFQKEAFVMAITRYDPFRDLFRLQDQLFKTFGETYGGSREETGLTGSWTPAVDVFEDGEAITLKIELPEVDAKDVDIQVEANQLTIRGERKLENAENRDGYHRIERTYGSFSRSFTLPTTVDTEHISAESRDGVLRVVLPKRAETKPRQIKVQVESARPSQVAANNKQ